MSKSTQTMQKAASKAASKCTFNWSKPILTIDRVPCPDNRYVFCICVQEYASGIASQVASSGFYGVVQSSYRTFIQGRRIVRYPNWKLSTSAPSIRECSSIFLIFHLAWAYRFKPTNWSNSRPMMDNIGICLFLEGSSSAVVNQSGRICESCCEWKLIQGIALIFPADELKFALCNRNFLVVLWH